MIQINIKQYEAAYRISSKNLLATFELVEGADSYRIVNSKGYNHSGYYVVGTGIYSYAEIGYDNNIFIRIEALSGATKIDESDLFRAGIVPIQNVFNKDSHVYKITTNIDLQGETLTLPSSCTLDFQGGKIIGDVVLHNTKIIPNGCVTTDYIQGNITGTYAKGQCLFDTTLNKPIWWTGTAWVDANGNDVDTATVNEEV